MVTFYWYPKCGTCRKAKKWLDDNNISVQAIHIVEQPPSKEQLRTLYEKSGLDLKKFFNTSGMKYRELGLKDKLKTMTEEDMLQLLSSEGMLIKRPIIINGERVIVGFDEQKYHEMFKLS
ncbi:arsenate reductase [Anoxybacillus flavithermus NBRC 109594]|uniref:Arsenate reductase n=1 Tax=Anoxybacillus flavithermus NBRC 109594 TaxID=1315967 RepID=R4G1H9_9BACL|nr:arsenate reductase family protein [Anoxybacillus flavithermus]GAC91898.1 arsenate reductase [Anoxybacillus flavithermus NBRC 109594]